MEKNQMFVFIILTIFYFAYLLKALVLTTKGIKVNQMGYGKKSFRTIVVEKLLKAVTFLMVPLQLSAVFSFLPLQIKTPETVQNIGLVISICGTICFICAMLTMGKNWRAGIAAEDSTNFVKHGIYRISRNPAFCGFDLIYLGVLLVFPGIIHAVAVCFTIVMFHFQILEEEKFLLVTFSEEYREYMRKTGRYFLFF